MAEIIGVRFKREGKQYYFDPQGLTVRPGMGVILETSWGVEYGECVRGNSEVPEAELVAPLRPILRIATAADLALVEKNRSREKEAFAICRRKVEEHQLDMKLVDVEMGFEGNKILFFFTSEGRVDFRALVKDLAAVFHSRIELRQIGVRDEAKMLGGLGICGRPFCCSSFLREFQPVSIKMAKTQNLSLNPTKISGTCGRLMCCLKYEQDAYEDLLRHSPKPDSFVETPDGVGDIISVNTLREKVRVRLDTVSDSLKIYHNSEIRVIRAGKGRRPDDYQVPTPQELEKLRRVKAEVIAETNAPESALHSAPPLRMPLSERREPPREERARARQQKHSPAPSRENKPHPNHPKGAGAAKPSRPFLPSVHLPEGAAALPEGAAALPVEPKQKLHKPRGGAKSSSLAAIEKALPQERLDGDKKPRKPYWRKKPKKP